MSKFNVALITLICSAFLHSASADTHAGLLEGAATGPERIWSGPKTNGSVHCLGNGRLCVYEQGPEVIQVFGPPYSATSIGHIGLPQPGAVSVSRRVPGTAIWEHRIRIDEEDVAVVTDFVDSELPCFVRHVVSTQPVKFAFRPEADLRIADNSNMLSDAGASGGFLVETPIGRPCVPFGEYPIPFAIFNQIAWKGAVACATAEDGNQRLLHFEPGESVLVISGGPSLDDAMAHARSALGVGVLSMLQRTRTSWADFKTTGRDFATELPAAVPMRDRLVQVVDDVAVLIKAQQAEEGGVLAGYPYHLGYVRDQYGTHRGLVALGHEEMSRDILAFYHRVFQGYGAIHNAQAFGIPGLFHVHENDAVEITGYITLQAFDYLQRSGDTDFVTHIFPMLEWAWEIQQPHLVHGMLPFNGDETYVAGSILPRTALNDGSAEATLLFIDSGQRLIDFAAAHGLWNAERVEAERQILESTRALFRENFWQDNRLITNNPERVSLAENLPRTRHGVCESCITVQWTLRSDNGRYVCVDCLNKPPLPKADPQVYTLQSVSLTPLYFHSPLFTIEELRPQVEAIAAAYEATGTLPSRPDGDIAVGYDYGLVLYALTELKHPLARKLYEQTLQLADDTGAWAEYYRNHQPQGTRCRPWESAINVEALLHWVEVEYGGE